MLYSPKYIAIDDNPAHLSGITTTFENLGSHCVGIQYNKETGIQDKTHLFKSVRILFCDFHLIDSSISTDNSKHCAVIVDLLETHIAENNGPFLLIIWTEYDQVKDELKQYLDLNIQKSVCRPLALFTIPKASFINSKSGEILDANSLKNEILKKVKECPQIAALLSLEFDCLNATNEILLELMSLIPDNNKQFSQIPLEIDIVMSRLAAIAVGKENVPKDPRSAIAKVIAPMLEDKILNLIPSTSNLWQLAVTKQDNLPSLSDIEVGKLNASLHIAKIQNENIKSKDWGAVIEIPQQNITREYFEARFGISLKQAFGEEFKISTDNRAICKYVVVRVGAACDYAQQKSGPINYLLGLIVPRCVQRKITNENKPPLSEWGSPVFYLDGESEPFNIFVNARFNFIPLASDSIDEWTVRFRLREQILMQLISYSSNHQSRVGIIELR